MKRYSTLILLFLVFVKLSGQGAYLPPDKPRLVISIVVESLKYDQLEKFRDKLGENGIKKLINEGTYFKNALYDYMLTQSAPGHATISTGAEPSTEATALRVAYIATTLPPGGSRHGVSFPLYS